MINYGNITSIEELHDLLEQILEKKKEKTSDQPEVVYAKEEYNNIFEHIIMFTNSDDPKKNKTLNILEEAIANLKKKKCDIIPELHIFIAKEVIIDESEDGELTISDSKNKLKLDEEDNSNTLILNRLGALGEENSEDCVSVLQDRGFLVLNPVNSSMLACNKYDTAKLLQKANIPQPNFCLMTKAILDDEKEYATSLKTIYKDWSDENEDLKFVVKILDGHGGTGVALITNKYLKAWLQLVFAVDSEVKLLIQRKEEADGGDIRVHVLTLRDRQVILGAMKRVKISKDFRSNVSLGATAEKIKLTPEQEQIALKTAKVSTLPWCAVDIMPIVKGTNKELGENAVLEINASPGTDGISEVLDYNFMNVMLSQLTEPNEFMLNDKIAGYVETATVDFGDNPVDVLAKLDTGNGAKASHIEVGEYTEKGKNITFSFMGKNYTFEKIDESNAWAGDTHESRPIIELPYLKLGRRVLKNVPMAIVKRREKNSNMLLNRDLLSKFGYSVSCSKRHLLSREMEKIQVL